MAKCANCGKHCGLTVLECMGTVTAAVTEPPGTVTAADRTVTTDEGLTRQQRWEKKNRRDRMRALRRRRKEGGRWGF